MFNLVEKELKERENFSITENGAIGYKSTDSALVDLNYKVSSFRNSPEEEIIEAFKKAFNEDEKYTLKWLFFARDIHEGLGERRLFRICYKALFELNENAFFKNLKYISEYGRWDDLVSLLNINRFSDEAIIEIIKCQLKKDLDSFSKGEPISLLAKWLPSENASSVETKKSAKTVRRYLNMSSRKYRLMLSKLRKHLKIVERFMCEKQWKKINYEAVPSLANLKYKDAFIRHDRIRRREYLLSVAEGEKSINMKVATPVDVVAKYTKNFWRKIEDYDETLEVAWKNLKDIEIKDTLVVADGSGSMTIPVNKGNTTALDVANALAIYTSEHNQGVYKNKYITFSRNPRFVDFSDKKTLFDKINLAFKYNEIANTNIEGVFDLILNIAIENKIPQDEMIKNILIISDMEFDRAQSSRRPLEKTLFYNIERKYKEAGYKLPKLAFWNVCSRTKTIPVKENDLGVCLISGYSQNVLQMVMSEKYDPYEVLIEILNKERYEKITC